jgi:hypothetical protein
MYKLPVFAIGNYYVKTTIIYKKAATPVEKESMLCRGW